jgi:hypothetical protein
MGRREHALSYRWMGWPTLIPRSITAGSVRIMVWVGGVEVTREECENGSWVVVAPRGAEPPLLVPYAQTQFIQSWARSHVSGRKR